MFFLLRLAALGQGFAQRCDRFRPHRATAGVFPHCAPVYTSTRFPRPPPPTPPLPLPLTPLPLHSLRLSHSRWYSGYVRGETSPVCICSFMLYVKEFDSSQTVRDSASVRGIRPEVRAYFFSRYFARAPSWFVQGPK